MTSILTLRIKVFDEVDKLAKRIDRKERKVLFGTGRYAQRTIRSKLRVRNKRKGRIVGKVGRDSKGRFTKAKRSFASAPGQPPRIRWNKSPLKTLVAFDVNLKQGSVLAGPRKFRTKRKTSRPPIGGTVPSVLEFGGSVKTPGGKTVHIEARPFVGPNLDKSMDNMRKLLESTPL